MWLGAVCVEVTQLEWEPEFVVAAALKGNACCPEIGESEMESILKPNVCY